MEGGIVLIDLLKAGVPLVLAIWLINRAVRARTALEEMSRRLDFRLKCCA